METKEIELDSNIFEYEGSFFDCTNAIKKDIPLILEEAEKSHKEEFEKNYVKNSLKPLKIRIYIDKETNKPAFGMVIYTINYKDKRFKRTACGNYYPFYYDGLLPHHCQASICW